MPVYYSRVRFADADLGFSYGPLPALARYCLSRGGYVCTPNALMLGNARKSSAFLNILQNASALTPDGVGALTLLRLDGIRAARCEGVALGLAVAAECERTGRTLFLYGGARGRAEAASLCLRRRFPRLTVAGTADGYTLRGKEAAKAIRASGADVVFVCLGSPAQEEFMHRFADKTRCFFGLGGSIDVYAGAVRRAPRPIGRCGLEWLWRMKEEPHRTKKLPDLAKFYLICGSDLVKKLKFADKKSALHGKIRQI